jgi:cystathionine beta-lyase family protein involved in aluminum resistance
LTRSVSQLLQDYYLSENISPNILGLSEEVLSDIRPLFSRIDSIREINQMKVLSWLRKVRMTETDFTCSSGYGYDDTGRSKIEQAFSGIFGAEQALVRNQIVSGTQAITIGLFGVLRPGDQLLSVTGDPYDTLHDVIGLNPDKKCGSLREFGIGFKKIDFLSEGSIDFSGIKKSILSNTRVIYIQKSRGYSNRPTLCNRQIKEISDFVKGIRQDLIVFVDNCYGEFVEFDEPCEVGVDLCAGSLIKNPGGGFCITGGYLAGKEKWIRMASDRLNAPGIGMHIGPSLGFNRMIAQGLFMAPHTVSESLKGAVFAAELFERIGYEVFPKAADFRGDIVQTLTLNNERALIDFCHCIQSCSPVDSFALPQPWDMPGYKHKILMAAGNYVQGSSIELTCDAPVIPPYKAYLQGGLVFDQVKYACMKAADIIQKKKMIDIYET